MNSVLQNQLIEIACIGAEEFKDLFYMTYDSAREQLFQFYREDCTILWNGYAFCKLIEARNLYKSLPPSKHEIFSMDAQPILPSLPDVTTSSILVTITGSVRYGATDTEVFNETFVLERDGADPSSPYFIRSSVRRDGMAVKLTKPK